MGEELDPVIRTLKTMFLGMVGKDPALLRRVLSPDMVLIHMTGQHQTREEFIGQVMDGTLRYRSIELVSVSADISDGTAEVCARTKTVASVYGGGFHRWRLELDTELRLTDDGWKVTRSSAGTFR